MFEKFSWFNPERKNKESKESKNQIQDVINEHVDTFIEKKKIEDSYHEPEVKARMDYQESDNDLIDNKILELAGKRPTGEELQSNFDDDIERKKILIWNVSRE